MFERVKALFRIGGAKVGVVQTLNDITDHPKISVNSNEFNRIRENRRIYKNTFPDVSYINARAYWQHVLSTR